VIKIKLNYSEKELLKNKALANLTNSVNYVDKKLKNAIKDSDGDGVINALDCQPYNPKKQGLVHDIIKNIKEKREIQKSRKEDVEGRIAQGDIKKEEDVDKYYAEGSKTKDMALARLRELQIKKARQQASHQETLKRVKEQAKQRVKQQYAPQKFQDYNFGSSLFSPPMKKTMTSPVRTKMVKTTNYIKGEGGLLKKVEGYKKVRIKTKAKEELSKKSTLPDFNKMMWEL